MQRLFDTELARRLCGALGLAADLPVPRRALDPVIAAYSLALGVDSRDVEVPAGGFSSFGDFFARRLKPGARPLAEGDDALAAPCDGVLVAHGGNGEPGAPTLHIKGHDYDADELLGGRGDGAPFAGGGHAVVYLHPRDYHRVHVPCRARLARTRHVPGARFPVAPWSERRVARIYQRNERVIFLFELDGGGALALVMVAAMGVGNIESPHAPVPAPAEPTTRTLEPPLALAIGDDLGAFRLGSTVALLWTRGAVEVGAECAIGGRVRQGQRLGRIGATGSGPAARESK